MKNFFDRAPRTMRDWLLLAAGVALVFAAAAQLPAVLRACGAHGLAAPLAPTDPEEVELADQERESTRRARSMMASLTL